LSPVQHRLKKFFEEDLWRVDPAVLGWPLGPTYRVLRVMQLAVSGVFANRATFTASALTYTTVLSLVPLLAFAFAVAKGVGAFDRLRSEVIVPFVAANLGGNGGELPPAVQTLRSAIDSVLDLVSHTDVSSLGLVGFFVLALAVVRVLSNVEDALNRIWGVRRARSPVRRISDYLSLAVVTPLLLLVAVSVTTAAQNSAWVEFLRAQPFGTSLVDGFFGLTPFLSVWIGFTLLFLLLPNTRVSVLSSLIGGLVGGTLWQLAQIGHVRFQAGMASYNAIYSSFAALPIFLVWIYVSWVTVMLGGEVAHAHQIVGLHRKVVLFHPTTHRQRESLALRAMIRIAERFRTGDGVWEVADLADTLGVAPISLHEALDQLNDAQLVALGRDGRAHTVLLARSADAVRVSDVLRALRTSNGDSEGAEGVVSDALEQLDRATMESPANLSLAELLVRRSPDT
jgi:membrane protein